MGITEHGSWIELDGRALAHNINVFRTLAGPQHALMMVVKSNAYGHGMVPIARLAAEHGADWLGVFSIFEALALREAGIALPILVFGPTPPSFYAKAAELGIRPTIGAAEALPALESAGVRGLKIHLKLETGTNRQGFYERELDAIARIAAIPGIEIEGAYTHYADIEDTTDHRYASEQLARFNHWLALLSGIGVEPPIRHTACSAAALLFPDTRHSLMRVGIGAYGLWPSKETRLSAGQLGLSDITLLPVMSWKTRIVQVKELAVGQYVSYGRNFRTTRPTRLAVLPIGYANGYDRRLSNTAYMLIDGKRASLLGRICMNMCMADVTDIPAAQAGDEVVLLGRQGEETLSAETLANWIGTINYEVVTRAEPIGPRFVV